MEQLCNGLPDKPAGVTVGTFDGVHVGHRLVVDYLHKLCEENGLHPVVVTFQPHPLSVIDPQRAPKLLDLPEERISRLQSLGVEVRMLEFNEDLRRQTAEQWLERLADKGTRILVVGYDNTFGSDGMSMNISDYRHLGARYGIEVYEAPILSGISSSAIRRELGAGKVEKVAEMLGHRYSVTGDVEHGKELGRRLGFPTANLSVDPSITLPAPGVYAADAITPDGKSFRAVVNIGVAPSIKKGLPLSVEAHLIDFDGDLYGQKLKVEFIRYLRDEHKFETLDRLKEAISDDIKAAEAL